MDAAMGMRVIAGLLAVGIFLVVAIFFILTLSRALAKCSPQSRTMAPAMVWLLLIPLVNLVWQFFVVMGMSNSLGNEFRARGMTNAPQEPGKQLGLAMCVCSVCGIIPYLGILAGLAGLVLWIMYWVKIAEFSRMLDLGPGVGVQMGGVPPGGMGSGI